MEKSKAFKNELRCYGYYLEKIKELKEKLNDHLYIESNVKAIQYDKIPCNASEEAIANHRLTMIEKGKEIEKELERYQNQVEYIDKTLKKLPKKLSWCLIEIYAKGKKYEDICTKMNWSVSGLYKEIDRHLNRIL